MKTTVKILLILLWSASISAQARLTKTEEEIRKDFPDYKFSRGKTNEGYKYITTDYANGVFFYMFDEVGTSNFNMYLVKEKEYANELAEKYNSKYKIISERKWKAMTKDNYIMYIQLVYDEELKVYVFKYSLDI